MATESTGLKCPGCGYDLTALECARCPECGERFEIVRPDSARSTRLTPVPDEVNPIHGVLQGFLGLLGLSWLDPRQSIWAVGSGMAAAAVIVLLIVWVVSRS
jgi:hypothetical protein